MIWFIIFLTGIVGASWALLSAETAFLVTIMGVILAILSVYLGLRGDKLIREIKELIKEWREDTNRRAILTDKMIEEGVKRSEEANRRVEKMIEEGWKRVEKTIEEGWKRVERMIEEGAKRSEEANKRVEKMIEEGKRETRELIRYMVRILEKMEERAEERHKELLGR
jgi:methyl-accepting chemotaxis protein